MPAVADVAIGDSPQDFAVECSVSVRWSALVVAVDIGELEPQPVGVGSRVWWVVEVVVVKVVAVVVSVGALGQV